MNFDSARGECGGVGETDVTETENANFVEFHIDSFVVQRTLENVRYTNSIIKP